MYYNYYYGSDYRFSNPADPECNSNIIAQKKNRKTKSKKIFCAYNYGSGYRLKVKKKKQMYYNFYYGSDYRLSDPTAPECNSDKP